MASTINLVTVQFTCDDCGEEWEEEFQDLGGIDPNAEHSDCSYAECDQCGCTCDDCGCDQGECDDCGCDQGDDEDVDEDEEEDEDEDE